MRRCHKNSSLILSYGSLSLVILCLLALLFPSCHTPASAKPLETSVSADLTSTIKSTLSVSLDADAELDVTPKTGGSFETTTRNLRIATNNITGYQIFLATTDDSGNLNPIANVSDKIPSVDGVLTADNFTEHLSSWGYNLASGTTPGTEFTAVPKASDGAILETNTTSHDDSYALSFAVAADINLASVVYTNGVIVSVIANPRELNMNDITDIQDLTADLCQNTAEHFSKSLKDRRDGKSYRVTKLKDGNCWMTENLALVGPKTLTSADSNVTSNWSLPTTYTTVAPSNTNNTNHQLISSWNPNNGYGTYYTYTAATAGTGLNLKTDGANASGSVCPKNWQLPLSGTMYNSTSGSFYNLLSKYDALTNDTASVGIITSEPLNFQFGGQIGVSATGSSSVMSPGSTSYYRSKTISGDAAGSAPAYGLNLTTANVFPSQTNSSYRPYGQSVRCVLIAD